MNIMAILVLALAVASPLVQAGPLPVYDSGAYNVNKGAESSNRITANSFKLNNNEALTDVRFWVGGNPDTTLWQSQGEPVYYTLFADGPAVTGGTVPGAVLASNAAKHVSISDTGNVFGSSSGLSGNIFEVDFGLASTFNALANTTYWLGINLSQNNLYVVNSTFTVLTSSGRIATSTQPNPGYNWTLRPATTGNIAFQLYSAVPEPGTLSLMVLGIVGLSFGWRRRT